MSAMTRWALPLDHDVRRELEDEVSAAQSIRAVTGGAFPLRTLAVCAQCDSTVVPFADQAGPDGADTWARAHRAGTGHDVVTVPGWPRPSQARRIAAAHLAELKAAPHGPGEPCTCTGCWACDGHVVGCTCDIDWDKMREKGTR